MLLALVTAVALRIMAIWLLVQLVLNLPTLGMLFASVESFQQRELPLTGYVVISGAFLLVGLLAAWLINKAAISVLARAKAESNLETTALSQDAQRLLFQLVGLFFIIGALARLPGALSFIPHVQQFSLFHLLSPAGLVFQLGVGLWLVVSSSFWVVLFQKLRGRG